MNAIILVSMSKPLEVINFSSYSFGAVLALFILGYLLYSLLKPEKF